MCIRSQHCTQAELRHSIMNIESFVTQSSVDADVQVSCFCRCSVIYATDRLCTGSCIFVT